MYQIAQNEIKKEINETEFVVIISDDTMDI